MGRSTHQFDEGATVFTTRQNRFFVLRHGRSEANELGLIASSPQVAVTRFGLTKVGRDQVASTIDLEQAKLGKVARIFTSDFLRARETAEIAAYLLGAPVDLSSRLRERNFGQWDGQSDAQYDIVWSADAQDPSHTLGGVESVSEVARRMSEFVQDVDQTGREKTYLIVSHGDPLQILITMLRGRDLRDHRQMDALATAELRPLCWKR